MTRILTFSFAMGLIMFVSPAFAAIADVIVPDIATTTFETLMASLLGVVILLYSWRKVGMIFKS